MKSHLPSLAQVLPCPTEPPERSNWQEAEEILQTSLPSDFKDLIDVYGAGLIDDYLLLAAPGCPNDVYDLIKLTNERTEANRSLWEFEDAPIEMQDEGNRLICWATTDNGEYLYWLVQPDDDPEKRCLMLNDASGETWERFDMTVTQFLAAVLTGDIHSEVLWNRFPQEEHSFSSALSL
ncbi:SMI1/KNR4 family protein [Streptomyces sp. NPDC006134]|uniref:SMI1/KNR4 family protein n=1 Tax=Streptomyces sp. NPDC006134 TaxID=3154467 RepID=UPI0033EDC8E0